MNKFQLNQMVWVATENGWVKDIVQTIKLKQCESGLVLVEYSFINIPGIYIEDVIATFPDDAETLVFEVLSEIPIYNKITRIKAICDLFYCGLNDGKRIVEAYGNFESTMSAIIK